MKCPQCQFDNTSNAPFCPQCGFNFQSQQQQQPAQPPRKNKLSTPLIIIGVVVGVCALCGIIGGIGAIFQKDQPAKVAQTNANTDNSAVSPPVQTKPTAAKTVEAAKDSTGVTMDNFNKLKTGMTYEQVVKILGEEGTVLSENEMSGYRTVMYQWKGGYVANMNCMFQNGKLISKAQFGL